MKDKLYELSKLILCLLIFFFIGDISIMLLKIFNFDILNNTKYTVIFQFILSLILLIVFTIIYFKTIKNDFKKIKKDAIKNIKYIIKMFLVFMIVKYVVSFISALIMVLLGFDANSMTSVNQNLIETYVKTFPILMLFSTAIFAPFYEEILFRIGFKKVIKNKYLFVLISGFLFGILHVFPLDDGVSLLL